MSAEKFPTAEPYLPASRDLSNLRSAAEACRGCDLYACATHVVFGEGGSRPQIIMVGEQPGDKEDMAGKPFVGPAGLLLHQSVEAAGLDPQRIYYTNAVKHFRFSQIGKRRQHRSPAVSHIVACQPWLRAEVESIKPRLIICLGATALRSVSGKALKVGEHRGKTVESIFGVPALVTVHPSSLLREPDRDRRQEGRAAFIADLALAQTLLRKAA